MLQAVADPGFPRGGGANSPGGGAPTYDFAKISQKPHEIERIWTPRGGARPLRPPLDPPLTSAAETNKIPDESTPGKFLFYCMSQLISSL